MTFSLILFTLIAFFWNASFPYNFYTCTEQASGRDKTAPIAAYLQQPFDFIGEGSQVIAFGSQDGTTVLKLFKSQHKKRFKLGRFVHEMRCPKEVRFRSLAKWQEKFRMTHYSYQLAFDHLQEETGLIALHFKSTSIPLLVQLCNKAGDHFEVDLCEHPFILQKRAMLLPTYLGNLLKENRLQEAKEAIARLKDFFITRTLKGFSDPRQTLSINYGFVGNQPIQIDAGKIDSMPILKQSPQPEIRRIHAHIDSWVHRHFPLIDNLTSSEKSRLVLRTRPSLSKR